MVRESLTEKVAFEKRTKGGERGSHQSIWKRAHAKAVELDYAWHVGGTVGRPVWLEQSE